MLLFLFLMNFLRDYSPERYLFLEGMLKRIKQLDLDNTEVGLDEKREVLRKLGVRKIRRVCLKDCLGSAVTNRVEQLEKSVRHYLEKHRERFEEDRKNGKLNRAVLEEQLGFDFYGAIATGKAMDDEYNCFDRKFVYFLLD